MNNFKLIILLFIFLLCNCKINAATQQTIDSLETLLSKTKEDATIKIQIELSKAYLTKNLTKSLSYGGRAVELAEKYNDKELIAFANLSIGDTYYEMSRFQSAIEFYEKALDYFYEQRTSENKIYIYTRLGDSEKMLGRYNDALFYYQKPLNLFLAQKNNKVSEAYNKIGEIYKLLDNFDQSMYYHQLALNNSNLTFDQNQIANTLKHIGSLYWESSLYDSSLFFFEKSLELYREASDTLNEANVLENIGTVYKDIGEFQKALDYNKKALELRNKKNNKKEIANSYNSIGSIYLANNDYSNAINFYNDAYKLRTEIEDILGIAQSQTDLSIVYRRMDNFNESLSLLDQALRNYKNIGNKSLIANSINQIGNIQKRQQKYDLALKSYLDAIKIKQEINDENEIASILIDIGLIYDDISKYNKALESFSKSLEIKRKYGNKKEISYCLQIIGNTYLKLNDYEKALEYYSESLTLRTEIGDKINIATSLKNIGNTYLNLGDLENSIKYLQEALKIRQEVGDMKGSSDVLKDIGNFYSVTNQSDKALEYYNQVIELSNKTGDLYLNALCKRKIGVIYTNKDNKEEGLSLIKESLIIGQNIDNLELIENAYYELFNYYYNINDKSNALENYLNYTLIKDSINERLNSQRLIEIQMNYELENSYNEISRIEGELSQLTAENKIRELEIIKQKNVRKLVTVIAAITLLLGSIISIQFLNKRKTNILLNEKIDEVDKSNKLLKDSEENLKILNATKDKFFSIIAHDLRNPFNALHGLTKHLLSNYNEFNKEEIQQSLEIIYNSADDLLELLENLLHWSRTQRGKIQFKPIKINLYEIVNKIFNLLSMNANKKEISLVNEIQSDCELIADYDMIMAILRNLISNAIKFSNSKNYVRISSQENNEFYEISVMDNGIGIAEEDIKKLFRIDVHHSTSGTFEEQGSGLGLILCSEFVERHHGKIWVESKLGKGSIFKFTISKKVKNENG